MHHSSPTLALAFFTFVSQAYGQLSSTEKADVGFTALQTSLGGSMPTGSGISASQTEAPLATGEYRPDATLFTGKTFQYPSGGGTGASWHATAVAQYFYGPNSLAPAIGNTATGDKITSFEVNDWLTTGALQATDTTKLPNVESNDIQNHSWVGSTGNAAVDIDIIRREDYAITRDDFVAVYGVNNSVGAVPNLLASAYNGIAVGLSNGNHSYGTTSVDGAGRVKPEIVVPTSATSWATPTVGSAAALLLEKATNTGSLTNATHHEVEKSLLLNGATKNESEFTHTWAHTQTVPLDTVYGAGELNIFNSYNNLVAGEYAASTSATVGINGWDWASASASSDQYYYFDIPTGYTAEFTATVSWDRLITAVDNQPGPGVNYSFNSALADLNLKFYNATGFILGSLVDQSVSTIDNVEHLYLTSLSAGRYALALNSNTTGQNYGLAWRSELTAIPEPSSLLLGLFALPIFRRKR